MHDLQILLSKACMNGDLGEVIDLVENRGVSIDYTPNNPMCSASRGGQIDVIIYLLSRGADITWPVKILESYQSVRLVDKLRETDFDMRILLKKAKELHKDELVDYILESNRRYS